MLRRCSGRTPQSSSFDFESNLDSTVQDSETGLGTSIAIAFIIIIIIIFSRHAVEFRHDACCSNNVNVNVPTLSRQHDPGYCHGRVPVSFRPVRIPPPLSIIMCTGFGFARCESGKPTPDHPSRHSKSRHNVQTF
ncbi:hypothetical protein FIBSPDRAFT_314843 [Athelia psychrophila]|uniref:Uncharacterized protein n=1 Tax=Athelia psychrophila TaxID=1759441 RepID=A0A166QN28_9AGAM|nr:hypothetical protein FIBSPDRAFT_314843 [Fibularhizoctonia sp. CBS 109695]